MHAGLDGPENRLVRIADRKGLTIDIPDHLRDTRLDNGFQRDAIERGGRLGIAPDPAVVFRRSDRQPHGFPRWCRIGNRIAGILRPGAVRRLNDKRRTRACRIRCERRVLNRRDLFGLEPFGQCLAA